MRIPKLIPWLAGHARPHDAEDARIAAAKPLENVADPVAHTPHYIRVVPTGRGKLD